MSLPMPLSEGTTSFSTGASRKSLVSAASEGFTRTSPATLSPCSSAMRSARQPPIDRPMRKISSACPRSSSYARSTSAYQSSHRVCAMSCQVVPWPGSRGRDTVSPAAASWTAQGRSDAGLPVNPWQSRTPVLPPEWKKGSAPGITGMTAVLSHLRSSHRRTRPRQSARRKIRSRAWRGQLAHGQRPGRPSPAGQGLPVVVWTWEHVSMGYWVVKAILGPLLAILFRPWSEGADNVPREGPAILAWNHLSFSDHFFGPLPLPRKVTFLAKSEYFTGRGVKGLLSKAFFRGVGQIPVDRTGGEASERALRTGLRVLADGKLLGIYPEGTRTPDGRLYRGKTGVARLALESGAPVIPCAMIGTFELQPPGRLLPRLSIRPGVRFGKPLDFSRYAGLKSDRLVLRAVTDEIMYAVMNLSGQEYVDEDAQRAKKRARPGGTPQQDAALPQDAAQRQDTALQPDGAAKPDAVPTTTPGAS